jgi:hydroxyethylthiazole kinase-like sugar kinase family protein
MTQSEVERIAVLETKVDGIDSKLDGLKKDLCDFIEAADRRYSAKWVETGAAWLIGVVLTAVIAAVLGLVLITH